MTNYKTDFAAKATRLETALLAISPELERTLPGFDRGKIRRFLARFAVLLGKIDAGKIKQPEYLAYGSPSLPTYLISQMDGYIQNAVNGAAHFVQNALPGLVEMQSRLEKAVGFSAVELTDVQRVALSETTTSLTQLEQSLDKIDKALADVSAKQTDASKAVSLIEQRVNDVNKDHRTIKELRESAELLASDDDEEPGAIEKYLQAAKEKLQAIEQAAGSSVQKEEAIRDANIAIQSIGHRLSEKEKQINLIEERAQKTLISATQAGLAASYTQERAKLLRQQYGYTGIFYGAIIIMALVVILYIIPALEGVITTKNGTASGLQSSLIALIRAAILAPFIWAIVFTSQRVQRIEMLQLDYAEKAAASLAYSGYRTEMDSDPGLLRKLRDVLLLRFAEHPERLLHKSKVETAVKVSDEGFEASTQQD